MSEQWVKYAYHAQGCEALPRYPDDRADRWPSHESMVLDERCSCGLRSLALGVKTENGTDATTAYIAPTKAPCERCGGSGTLEHSYGIGGFFAKASGPCPDCKGSGTKPQEGK